VTTPSVLRTTSDLTTLHALIAVLARLSREAPDLVVARGSFAVFAHAPSIARIPNDLDLYWLGASEAVVPLLEGLSKHSRLNVLQTRTVTLPDDRIVSLHRADVLVWLDDSGRPTHRTWVDIGTSRRTARSEVVQIEMPPGTASPTRVVTLLELLVEKLFVYLEAVEGGRALLRWTDLFDMLVLLRGAPALGALEPHHIRAECVRYFTSRGTTVPTDFPLAPTAWRSPWHRLVGPIARDAPRLDRACEVARAFWRPVFHHFESNGGPQLHWDASHFAWVAHTGNGFRSSRLRGDERQHPLDIGAP
jgi:hypothetical protein